MSSFSDDDDGIIDLHALSKPRPFAPGNGSIFASEPPPAFVTDTNAAPRTSSTVGVTIAAIAGGVLFLALAGVGLKFAFRSPAPVVRTGVTVSAAAPPPATTEAPVAAAPTTDPAPPATADDDSSSSPKKKKGRHGVRRSFASSEGKKEAVSRPARAADPCGCKGNFDCNLRCAAQK
ncbi:MAG TPA: hypothetical protein VIF62_05370 [Labilithrix sp.]|jgi:cell division septation protein DedD